MRSLRVPALRAAPSGIFGGMTGGAEQRARRVRWAIAALVVAGLLVPTAWAFAQPADAEVRVFEPRHRVAEDLLPIAEVVIGEAGRVSVDPARNGLLLVAPAADLDRAFAVLEEQDRAPVVVEIHYRAFDFDQWNQAGYELVDARDDEAPGFAVARVRKAELRGERHGTGQSDEFSSVVRVASGSEVAIGRGAIQPLVTRDLLGARVAGVSEGRRGLVARPRVLAGGRVHLEIEYRDERVDTRGRVDGTRGKTSITVGPAELVAIGDLTTTERTAGREGRVWSTRDGQDERIHLIELRLPEGNGE